MVLAEKKSIETNGTKLRNQKKKKTAYVYEPITFDEVVKNIQWKKESLFNK